MKNYIATVWYLTSMSEATEGDAGIRRIVCRFQARNESHFKAIIHDRYSRVDVDCQVWFGPISISKVQ